MAKISTQIPANSPANLKAMKDAGITPGFETGTNPHVGHPMVDRIKDAVEAAAQAGRDALAAGQAAAAASTWQLWNVRDPLTGQYVHPTSELQSALDIATGAAPPPAGKNPPDHSDPAVQGYIDGLKKALAAR